jgi:mono/diheme cytochrome c family protein
MDSLRSSVGAAIAVAFTLAACGGQAALAPHPAVRRTPHPTVRRTPEPASASSRQIFTSDCGVCHSLDGGENPHKDGGDLKRLLISRAALTQFVSEMPVRHSLAPRQVRAIVDYIYAVEHGSG